MLDRMPTGGGYAVNKTALDRMEQAVAAEGNGFKVDPTRAKPSFCSGATYLVFTSLFDELVARGRIRNRAEDLSRLSVRRQKDGVGVWGRWNANGPGVAKLFHDTGLGSNFESIDRALPGDFMKIFWTEEIGAKEFGHLVVFLGWRTADDGERIVSFWSSNQPDGYGRKEVPESKIKWAVFSRLLHPEMFVRLPEVDSIDRDLVDMQKRSFTKEQVRRMVGMITPPPAPTVATRLSPAREMVPVQPPPNGPTAGTTHPPAGPPKVHVETLVDNPPSLPPLPPRLISLHVVKTGETISGIAQKHGVGVKELCAANHLSSPDLVKAGQLLKIPPKTSVPKAEPEPAAPSPSSEP
ncbi:MAG: LysM peptidoglycan-binding domain-containing protein [Verrucomicrobiae bacterium]|nr:LysM peptidoglycan-binding domain-containing protein [Verrucomicrobiae bacterium]